MIEIILKHLEKYPLMQLQDIAKLLYQSEFGGGHMIADPQMSLRRLQEEYRNLGSIECQTVVEAIGDGMCRMYLSCLTHGMLPETLNEIFVQSANHRTGTIAGLEKKIAECLRAYKEGLIPFREQEAKAFFENWKEAGYPATSHSGIYRENYQPAYRVIEESYVKVYEVIQRIEKERPRVIAIDGMSASGKTTLGALLHRNYPESNLIHMDSFFLRPHQRTEARLKEIGGNLDYERFQEEIILHLNDKNGFRYQEYDCQSRSLGEVIEVSWKPLTIIEGAYSHHPYFGEVYDMKLFCEITAEEQTRRILQRNGEMMLKRFVNEWIPKENQYFEAYHIREKSECI